jgi:MFS transporter, ACS family, hexuronate transporter
MGALSTSSYRWIILLLATLVQVGVSILQQAPAALGPVLTRDLDLTRAQIGILSSAIWGGMLFAMLPVGLLIDRRGERQLITVGVTGMALLGLWQTGVTIGGLMAALLLPPVAVRFGWEVALGLAAGVALFTVLCFALFYREFPTDAGKSSAGEAAAPRVPVGSMVRDPSFLATTGYAFVLMGVQGSSASYLALSLHEEVHLSVVAAGAFLAVFQIGGIAGRVGWGVISDRVGRRRPVLLLVGLVAMGSCLAMAFAGKETVIPLVAVLAFLLGCSAMGWNGLYLTLLSESVPMHAAATAMGASLTIAFVGMFFASPLFGLVADLTGSYGASWLGLAGWTAVGIVLGLLAKESKECAKP